jgi:hypothetical protein
MSAEETMISCISEKFGDNWFLPALLKHCLISFGIHYPSHTPERSLMFLVVLHGQSHEIPRI